MLSNNNVIALSKWTEEKFNVEVFPADKGWDHSIHEVKEITLIKFYYPLIMIIKGWNEIMMFSIPEKMYYYIKLNSPIAVLCTTVSTSYNLDLKALIDLGNYYGYIAFNFSIGSYNSIYASLYKRYMEKENLPREKVLTCFEPQKIKFLSKEEDALVLQFPNFIYCLGLLTFELFSITDSDLKLGELIHISYAGMLEWRLDDTEIIFKQSPINFNDRNYGDSVFESQDTLKIVKVEYDNTTYANMIYI